MKKALITLFTITLLLSLNNIFIWFKDSQNIEELSQPKTVIKYISFDTINDSLNLENVYHYLKCLDIKYFDIVFAQCILETGYLKSKNCLENNNLFGFRYQNEYLKFDNWKQSCMYYYCWQCRKYKGGDYFNFLEQVGYASDKDYKIKLNSILKNMIKY